MKRLILYFAFIIFVQFSFGQNDIEYKIYNPIEENSKPFLENDTLFIKKDLEYYIFIDTTRNPKYYEKLDNFKFDKYDLELYEGYLKSFRENNIKLTKHKLDNFPKKWRPLMWYNGEYYVYYPCDFCSNYRISITDTTLIEYWCEGPSVNKMSEYKKLNDNTFYFQLYELLSEKEINFTIYLIDKEKGIAVFKDDINGYSLMIDVEKINNFPIIVNKCEFMKVDDIPIEYQNDLNIDFEELIKNVI